MAALHLLESEGIPSYHLPGSYMFNDMTSAEWNAITEELLATVFEIHRPSVFVFDGAFPYRGMLNAIKNRTGLTNVWLRRGAFKKGGTKIPVDSIEHFHHILRPGDSVETTVEEIDFSTPVTISNQFFLPNQKTFSQGKKLGFDWAFQWIQQPFTFNWVLEKSTTLRDNLRWRFGCSTSMKTCTWWWENPSLGTVSNSKEIACGSFETIQIRSCSTFDFAIMAGGYNSYHEAIAFALPTLFIPNLDTGMDDQLARVKAGEAEGACMVLSDQNEAAFRGVLERLMDERHRKNLQLACNANQDENGAVRLSPTISPIDELNRQHKGQFSFLSTPKRTQPAVCSILREALTALRLRREFSKHSTTSCCIEVNPHKNP